MTNTLDLCLGSFLIICGLALSLLNLRRVVKKSHKTISSVLLSENVLLMCIGIAFVSRSLYNLNSTSISMKDMEERTAIFKNTRGEKFTLECGFVTVLISYGPLIVSLVNSFLSLIIDNYMHYKMIYDIKVKNEENNVRGISEDLRTERKINFYNLFHIWKKYFSYAVIVLQWIIPVVIALLMYPMGANPTLGTGEERSADDSCITMLNFVTETCTNSTSIDTANYSIPIKYLEVYEYGLRNVNDTKNVDSILSNVFNIIANFNNQTDFFYTNESRSLRRPKYNNLCTKICYLDNKNLLLYMFVLVVMSYFVPITISVVILTKIHVMEVKKPNMKTHVTRELLYNILFWTPVMFDTFLSLMFCSYSMDGMRTSLFNVIANIYQTVKNFMNTKYFKENLIAPV